MSEVYDCVPDNLARWYMDQHMFWVATAPLSIGGHINLSPKGVKGTFHIVDKNKVFYEDLTGSGGYSINYASSESLLANNGGSNRRRDYFTYSREWTRRDHVLCIRGASEDFQNMG